MDYFYNVLMDLHSFDCVDFKWRDKKDKII